MGGKAARRRFALTAIAVIACLAAGIVLIISGSASHPPAAAPLPGREFTINPAALSKLPPLKPGKITLTGAVPGWPGKPCLTSVTRSHLVIASLCVNGHGRDARTGRLAPQNRAVTGLTASRPACLARSGCGRSPAARRSNYHPSPGKAW
jgi:hypothetical protein